PIGAVHQGVEDQAVRADHEVPLAPLDLLATVVAADPPWRRLHRLALADGGAGGGVTTQAGAPVLAEPGREVFAGAVTAPEANVVIHRLPRRRIMRQEPPAATTADDREDAVETLTPLPAARRSTRLGGRQQRFDEAHSR